MSEEIKKLLDKYYLEFCSPEFILNDPIQIPHKFSKKEDVEIAGFLTANISWGLRKIIISNAEKLMQLMDNSPYDFIYNCKDSDLKRFLNFKHRTFNSEDCKFFIKSLKNIYKNHNGLENVFTNAFNKTKRIDFAINDFRKIFFEIEHPNRTLKHIPNIEKKSAAKKINMFLRWMIRKDSVDFGLWTNIPKSALLIPLDVHVGNVSRKLGLIKSPKNNLDTVIELSEKLSIFDSNDPIKYDFSLFGYGVNNK